MRTLKLFALKMSKSLTLGKEGVLKSSVWVSHIPNHFLAIFLNALQQNTFWHISFTILYFSSHSWSCRLSSPKKWNSAQPKINFWVLHHNVVPPTGSLLFSSLLTFVCCRAGWAQPSTTERCLSDFTQETDSKLPRAFCSLANVRAHQVVSGGKSRKL